MYAETMVRTLRAIHPNTIMKPALAPTIEWAIERTKKAIGGDCGYYLARKGGKAAADGE